MDLRIIDLDGALLVQGALSGAAPAVHSLREMGPTIRQACTFAQFRRFQSALAENLGSSVDARACLTFYGSGDFHHVTLALLRRLTTPCNLLVIDNHPDWMRGIPVMHCGTWLRHALQLPQINQVFHVGGDVDFDNAFRWLAPWSALRSGRVTVLPAVRRYGRGAWSGVPHDALRRTKEEPLTKARLAELLDPYRRELGNLPLYISLDKDVMIAEDAAVNWDSGHLRLSEVLAVVEGFVNACGRQLAGVDVMGDWSPVVVKGMMRRLLHKVEHPNLEITPFTAARCNEETNQKLLRLFRDLGVLTREREGRGAQAA